jgi:hypothetical protein
MPPITPRIGLNPWDASPGFLAGRGRCRGWRRRLKWIKWPIIIVLKRRPGCWLVNGVLDRAGLGAAFEHVTKMG